jgi:hypothetical protein
MFCKRCSLAILEVLVSYRPIKHCDFQTVVRRPLGVREEAPGGPWDKNI